MDGQRALFHIYSGLDIVHEKEGATATRHYYANGLTTRRTWAARWSTSTKTKWETPN